MKYIIKEIHSKNAISVIIYSLLNGFKPIIFIFGLSVPL